MKDIDKSHMFSLIYGKNKQKKQLIQVEKELLRNRKDVGVLAARTEEWVNMNI